MKKIKKLSLSLYKNPLFTGSFVMFAGSISASFVNYIYHLIMGRMLGPEYYGVLASIFSVLYIVSIVPTSVSYAIVKFVSGAKDKRETAGIFNSINHVVLRASIFLSIVLLVVSPFIAKFLKITDILSVSSVSPILFFTVMALVIQSTFQGLLVFVDVVLPNIISALTKLIIGVLLVFLGFSVRGAMLGVVIGGIASYLFARFKIEKISKLKNKIEFDMKPFYKYTLPVFLQSLAFTSLITIDVILAKHFLTSYEVGLYASLSTLGKIIFFGTQPITQAMFPIVSKKNSRGEGYKKVFFISLGLTMIGALGVVTLYYLFPQYAIGILFGEKYLAAQEGLFWMGLVFTFYAASSLLANFSLSIGKTKVVIIPIVLALVQIFGILFWHKDMMQIIFVTLAIMSMLFVGLIGYLGYNQLHKVYVKSKK